MLGENSISDFLFTILVISLSDFIVENAADVPGDNHRHLYPVDARTETSAVMETRLHEGNSQTVTPMYTELSYMFTAVKCLHRVIIP